MFPLSDTIFLRDVRTSGLVDNSTINIKGTERSLDKLESVISTKNLRHNRILSDNLHDEVGDRSESLRAVAWKVDPTHMSIIIKKHNIVMMT